jgi:hypothetical protein
VQGHSFAVESGHFDKMTTSTKPRRGREHLGVDGIRGTVGKTRSCGLAFYPLLVTLKLRTNSIDIAALDGLKYSHLACRLRFATIAGFSRRLSYGSRSIRCLRPPIFSCAISVSRPSRGCSNASVTEISLYL